ncbi:hypothetical protein ACWGCC_03740 [Streptomyces nigrescens]
MGNLADDSNTDVEIFRRWGAETVYADSRTGAEEELLHLLDALGFERHSPMPIYTWHELPEGLDEHETTKRATRAWILIAAAGYTVNLAPDLHCPETDRLVRKSLTSEARATAAPTAHPAASARPIARHSRPRSR